MPNFMVNHQHHDCCLIPISKHCCGSGSGPNQTRSSGLHTTWSDGHSCLQELSHKQVIPWPHVSQKQSLGLIQPTRIEMNCGQDVGLFRWSLVRSWLTCGHDVPKCHLSTWYMGQINVSGTILLSELRQLDMASPLCLLGILSLWALQ